MKKTLIALLIAAPISLTLSGCVVSVGGGEDGHNFSSDFDDREYGNRKKIAKLALGASYADAYTHLGVADFTENYQSNGDNIQVLFYRTHRTQKDGLTTKDECTYLHFVNGVLKETGAGAEHMRNVGG
ncbi:DUF3192 domain-containing protein [Colwelliaceae bacterium 6471]